MIKWILLQISKYKKRKEYKAKIKELRKRDPFNYKNF